MMSVLKEVKLSCCTIVRYVTRRKGLAIPGPPFASNAIFDTYELMYSAVEL